MDGCIETSQIVCTCDKNILYAPIPQTIQYGRPELCALIPVSYTHLIIDNLGNFLGIRITETNIILGRKA